MAHTNLVGHCIRILNNYSEDMQSLDSHLNKYLKFHAIAEGEHQTFISEVFSGCVRYGAVINVVVDGYYNTHGKHVLKSEQDVYKVFCYLCLFRLDELGMAHFRRFVRTQNINKIHKFLSFFLNERNLLTWMKDEWSLLYDVSFVQKNLLSPLQRWLPELHEMLSDMEGKLQGKPPSARRSPETTKPVPFNLTQPRPRSIPMPQPIPKLQKHEPIKPTVFREPKQFSIIEVAKEQNRRKAEERLIEASKDPFACANPEKSDKTKRRLDEIITEQNSKLQFDKKKSHQLPASMQNSVPVKLTTAAILKEGAFYKRQEEEVIRKLEALEAGARDPSQFLAWQSKMRQKDTDEQLEAIERRRIEGKLSHEEAILARQRVAEENQRKAEQMKQEAAEYMREYMKVKVEEEKEMRRLVEAVLDTRYNAKESKKKLQEYKRQIVQEVNEESRELARQALEEAEEEMRRKLQLIQEIRAFEAVASSANGRQKVVDLTTTPGYGLLSEMSIVELRERLAWMKSQQKQAEEDKRDSIISTKQARDHKLMDTLAVISKHRQEKSRSAAIRLEDKKATHGQREEIRSAELSQLQARLEEKKAERRSAQHKARLVPNQASAKRTAQLIREKQSMEESRWNELERTRERQAAMYAAIKGSSDAQRLLAPNPVSLKS